LFFVPGEALALELRENGAEIDVASVLDGHGRVPTLGAPQSRQGPPKLECFPLPFL
jgi:hypothetical protein